MEAFAVLLVLGLVVVVFVLPIAAFVRSGRAAREAEQLSARLTRIEIELARLRAAERQEESIASPAPGISARAAQPETGPSEQPAATTGSEVREQLPQQIGRAHV